MADAQALLHFIIQNLPHAALLVLVGVVLVLMAKDVINGMRRPFLRADRWQALQLVDRVELTHNTRRFRFALPHADQLLGLPLGQHITLKAALPGGADVMRPYTPTSSVRQRGHVDFVVKVYPEGKMSRAMDALPLGGSLWFKGPRGRFAYAPGARRAYGMLAGGTGITPMFQLAQEMLRDNNDATTLSLIFANVAEEDILLRAELDAMARRCPARLAVRYVLNQPPPGWAGGVGFISADMIR
jgi:cytochrome-b5 reductase